MTPIQCQIAVKAENRQRKVLGRAHEVHLQTVHRFGNGFAAIVIVVPGRLP